MSLSLKLAMKLSQKLSLKQRIALQQKLQLQIRNLVTGLQDEIVGNSAELFRAVVERMLGLVKDKDLREAIGEIWDQGMQELVLKSAYYLVSTKNLETQTSTAKGLALNYLWQKFNGRFVYEDTELGDKHSLEPDLPLLRMLVQKPEQFMNDKAVAEKLAKTGAKETKENAIRQVVNMTNAETAGRILESSIEAIASAILAGLSFKDPGEIPLVRDFLLELQILERFNREICIRTEKRFIANFSPVRYHHDAKRFKNAFTNLIGELTLVGMGILNPVLFCHQRAVIEDDVIHWVSAINNSGEQELTNLLNRLGLKTGQVINWNRWSLNGKRSSLEGDNMVRDFITGEIRKDQDLICDWLGYASLFERIQENNETSDARKDGLLQLMGDYFTDDFNSKLRSLIKERWFLKLQEF
jgi:hypothetical protein